MSAVKKIEKIQEKNKSLICLGLDLDPKRMPGEATTSSRAMFDFALNIVEATKDLVCAYKPNLAFFENLGGDGLSLLRLIVERIPDDIPIILDGKRGDISNTANHYASALYDKLGADWVTINPYMGYDSMRPFIERKDKGTFVLCLTSNAGSRDFQQLVVQGGKPLYSVVAEKVAYWNKDNNCGLVVGATHPQQLAEIRQTAGSMPLLIPGVGAQGGALEQAVIDGTANFTKLAVINVCRSVLYASNGKNYAERARAELLKLNETVSKCRESVAESDDSNQKKPEQENREPEGQEQGEKREQERSSSIRISVDQVQSPAQPDQPQSGSPGQDRPTEPAQSEAPQPDQQPTQEQPSSQSSDRPYEREPNRPQQPEPNQSQPQPRQDDHDQRSDQRG